MPKLSVLPHGHYARALAEIERAKGMVEDWLRDYAKVGTQKATQIAQWLASSEHGSHGKPISVVEATASGLKIKRLEDDQGLQDLVLAVFHATMITFDSTACVKFVENHLGRGFYQGFQILPGQPQQQAPPSV